MDNLNEFLTNLRKKKYTLDKIAELIPVSKQGYFNWEKGHRDWKLDVLIKLSAILNFELKIVNGELFIKENVEMIEKPIKRKNESEYEIVEDFERNQSGTFSHLFLGGGSPLFYFVRNKLILPLIYRSIFYFLL